MPTSADGWIAKRPSSSSNSKLHLREHRGDRLEVDGGDALSPRPLRASPRQRRPTRRLRCSRRPAYESAPLSVPGGSIRIVEVPMPVTPAPMAGRNWHSSTTCGSQAAFRISVGPVAWAAASSAVSVPVTDASSRYIETPLSPSGASIAWPAGVSTSRAPIADSARRCVAMLRRAGKSPPGGASTARFMRPTSAPRSSTEPRSRPTSDGSGSADVMSRHVTRTVDVPSPSNLGAERPQEREHHGDVANLRDVANLARLCRSAGTPPESAAPRSCCRRPRWSRTGSVHRE